MIFKRKVDLHLAKLVLNAARRTTKIKVLVTVDVERLTKPTLLQRAKHFIKGYNADVFYICKIVSADFGMITVAEEINNGKVFVIPAPTIGYMLRKKLMWVTM